jgi:hypothetical protein
MVCSILCWNVLKHYNIGLERKASIEFELHMSSTNLIKQHVESLLVFDAALNDALKEEVKRLKIATGQAPNMNGNTFNGGLSQQQQQQQMASYFSQPQQMQYFGGHQVQHHHPNHQPQSQNLSNGGRSVNDSMDFM